MPLIDKPLPDLYEYQGRNPKPKDHDAYWKKALAEMNALDPEIELRPHKMNVPYAECFDLYFTGVGGSRVHAKYLRPKKNKTKHPAVLQFHGYTGNAGDWWDKLGYVGLGFSVAALDCRGQGGSSENSEGVKGQTLWGHIIRGLDDSPEKLLYRQNFLDTAQLAKIVMGFEEVDPARVGAMGGSQGGGLTLACVSLEPRIKRAAPTFPFLSDYKRVWEMDLAEGAYEELRTYFRKFDPRHEREDAIWNRLGYIDVQHLAGRIKAEVLMGVGLMDKICPPSTQFAAYNKITSKKSLAIYPDFGHEALPGFNDQVFNFMAEL
ncbi:MAG TPA: acetylxylan esterase [Planctomycetota bacterium]|nr:acetylxylan esterase [Planctomycetota bacterium]